MSTGHYSNERAIDIPVNREPQTFEQHRRNMLTNLERGRGDSRAHNWILCRNDWADEIDNWINSSWRSWDDEMRRMRRNMFALMPLDTFGLSNWGGFGSLPDPFALMNRMEDEITDLRNRLDIPNAPVTGAMGDFLKDAYELGDDGKVHFKVLFDVKDFAPEDVKVNTTDRHLTVHAKKVSQTDRSKSSREFFRMIKLPDSIDQNQLKCQLTNDGVLMLDAPVKSPDYQSITFKDDGKLGIRPKTEGQIQTTQAPTKDLVVKGISGPTIVDDGASGKRVHVEVPFDPIYKPEDLHVSVDSNRVVVSGRHYKESSGRNAKSSSFAEFSHSYEIPETVDPLSVTAQVIGGKTLVLEAPLMKHHALE